MPAVTEVSGTVPSRTWSENNRATGGATPSVGSPAADRSWMVTVLGPLVRGVTVARTSISPSVAVRVLRSVSAAALAGAASPSGLLSTRTPVISSTATRTAASTLVVRTNGRVTARRSPCFVACCSRGSSDHLFQAAIATATATSPILTSSNCP